MTGPWLGDPPSKTPFTTRRSSPHVRAPVTMRQPLTRAWWLIDSTCSCSRSWATARAVVSPGAHHGGRTDGRTPRWMARRGSPGGRTSSSRNAVPPSHWVGPSAVRDACQRTSRTGAPVTGRGRNPYSPSQPRGLDLGHHHLEEEDNLEDQQETGDHEQHQQLLGGTATGRGPRARAACDRPRPRRCARTGGP